MFARHRRAILALALGIIALGIVLSPLGSAVERSLTAAGAPLAREQDGRGTMSLPAASPAARNSAADTAAKSSPTTAPAAMAAPAGAAPQAPAPDLVSTAPWDRQVIRTAQLTLQVADVDGALDRVFAIARAQEGLVTASQARFERVGTQEQRRADVTLQVPGDRLDVVLEQLRGLAVRVETEQVGSQDVTEEMVDLDSQIRNLRATETALVRLMDRAQRIEEILPLQRELTNIRGQIEKLQGRQQYLERRTAMATITLALRLPPTAEVNAGTPGWDPLVAARRGWETSVAFLQRVADVAITTVAFGWWLVPLAAGAVYLWRRRSTHPQAPAAPPAA